MTILLLVVNVHQNFSLLLASFYDLIQDNEYNIAVEKNPGDLINIKSNIRPEIIYMY